MSPKFTKYESLANKTVFITGGASGIGAFIVEAFVANGSRVAFVDILKDEARALVDRLSPSGNAPLFLECDLTNIDALRNAIAEARKKTRADRGAGQQCRQRSASTRRRGHA